MLEKKIVGAPHTHVISFSIQDNSLGVISPDSQIRNLMFGKALLNNEKHDISFIIT